MGEEHVPTSNAPRRGRLLVNILDEVAQKDPLRPFVYLPKSNSPEDGWEPLSYGEAANAVNYIAHELVKVYGRPPADNFPTVAYIGPNDVRYILFMLGASKAGYKSLMISPRNTDDVQVHLFEETDCRLIWHPSSHAKFVQPWLKRRDMSATTMPDLETLTSAAAPHFPYEKTAAEAEWDPFLVLHTSGSTGFPKPVISRQGLWSKMEEYRNWPEFHGTGVACNLWADSADRAFLSFPLFHAAGLWLFAIMTFYEGKTCALPIAGQPMSPDLVRESITQSKADAAVIPSSILEEIGRGEEGILVLQKMAWVIFGGASLAPEIGQKLAERGVMLQNAIGASE